MSAQTCIHMSFVAECEQCELARLRTRVSELEEAARVVIVASGWEAESRAKGELLVLLFAQRGDGES